MPIIIRIATPADIPFLVACNAAMALETEHKALDREVLTRGTRAVFDDPRRGFYLGRVHTNGHFHEILRKWKSPKRNIV